MRKKGAGKVSPEKPFNIHKRRGMCEWGGRGGLGAGSGEGEAGSGEVVSRR